MEPSRPNSVSRLITLSAQLNDSWNAYITKEGDAHRSDLFERVSLDLDSVRRDNSAMVITEREVLSLLGLPDRGMVVGDDSLYVYYYWRTETRSQWDVMVLIHGGRFENSGWNDASVGDFSKFKQYRAWSDLLGSTK
jgi:hypothetical protein